jgi:glycosyltransferase involved in cell wall biosynthesis
MKILFIPMTTYNLRSNEHIPNRIRLLSRTNEVIGLNFDWPPYKGVETIQGLARSLAHGLRVISFGIRHRHEFELIYTWEPFFSIVGLCIALFTGKPCIRDNAIVTGYHYKQMKTIRSAFTTFSVSVFDRAIFKFLKKMIVLSEDDKKAYIEQGCDSRKIEVVPLSVDLELGSLATPGNEGLKKQLAGDTNKQVLIFTGIREYLPNLRAVYWINDRLAPAMSRSGCNARILLTGSGKLPPRIHPALTFTGFVPNYFEYLQAADIVIAPLQPRSGVLVKVLDAMSCGKPVVLMAGASKGIPEIVDRYNAAIAGDNDEFIAKCLFLIQHPEEARRIGANGKKTMEQYYSADIWGKRMDVILGDCVR